MQLITENLSFGKDKLNKGLRDLNENKSFTKATWPFYNSKIKKGCKNFF